jgi:hypothetical protein
MSVIHALFDFVGTWFGFVGSCVASPTGACVPFLAFFAIGVAAGAALFLVLLAYGAAGFDVLRAIRLKVAAMRSKGSLHKSNAPRQPGRAQPAVNGTPATA